MSGLALDTLPLATVAAVAKRSLGGLAIGRDGKAALQRAAGVFILHLAAASNDVCQASKRSTLTAPDVLRALDECDLSEFKPALQAALEGFRQEATAKKVNKPPAPKRARKQPFDAAQGSVTEAAGATDAFRPAEGAEDVGDTAERIQPQAMAAATEFTAAAGAGREPDETELLR